MDLAIRVATIPTVAWRTFERLMRARRKRLERTVVVPAPVPGPVPVATQPLEPQPVQPQPVELPRRPARGGEFRHDVAVISTNGRASVPLGLAFAKGGL